MTSARQRRGVSARGSAWVRVVALLALAGLLAATGRAMAQNGSAYHVLQNGADTVYAGIGTQAGDGLGTWIPGEDLRGSHLTALGGFGTRVTGFVEEACVLGHSSTPKLSFPLVLVVEQRGGNPNVPIVFTDPPCAYPAFPLGNSAGMVPYGMPPGSSASFVVASLPSFGPPGLQDLLLPDEGLSTGVATADVVLAIQSVNLPISSTGVCWSVKFTFQGSGAPLHDGIDGLWHWVANSQVGDQYWSFSTDERNVWQSGSVASANGVQDVLAFLANADYSLSLLTREPDTVAALLPQPNPPFAGTGLVPTNEYGAVGDPNGGFDIGRGSHAFSLSGEYGVPNPLTGQGNQNPASNPGAVPALGFVTFDAKPSLRATWLSFDVVGAQGLPPGADAGVTVAGGLLRLPVHASGFPQALTSRGLQVFGHATAPVPGGPYFGGIDQVVGASWQVVVRSLPAACTGLPINFTYGTSGREGTVGAPGRLTFDPAVADISGSRELFLVP